MSADAVYGRRSSKVYPSPVALNSRATSAMPTSGHPSPLNFDTNAYLSPPHQGSHMSSTSHLNNKRKHRPSPSPSPSPPTGPTQEYLATSLETSSISAYTSRKLLVLDLNGSLLLRSPRPPASSAYRRDPPWRNYNRQITDRAHPQESGYSYAPQSRLRKVYPRPYMPSFVSYLSHPDTLAWLDTMIWSSAMPNSVEDMVDKCFGAKTDVVIKAVWARDTLGLSPQAYHSKVDTIKNLEKIWTDLYLNYSCNTSSQRERFEKYSARTTLLLDDSPGKARLQPWNHLCISEYNAKCKQEDEKLYVQRQKDARSSSGSTDSMASSRSQSPEQVKESDVADPAAERIARRKAKKEAKKAGKVAQSTTNSSTGDPEKISTEAETTHYDEMILGVIGVLDGLREQSNIAAWVRSGGLFQGVMKGDKLVLKEGPELSESDDHSRGTMWFEDHKTIRYWVERGRAALKRLGIDEQDGIEAWYQTRNFS